MLTRVSRGLVSGYRILEYLCTWVRNDASWEMRAYFRTCIPNSRIDLSRVWEYRVYFFTHTNLTAADFGFVFDVRRCNNIRRDI